MLIMEDILAMERGGGGCKGVGEWDEDDDRLGEGHLILVPEEASKSDSASRDPWELVSWILMNEYSSWFILSFNHVMAHSYSLDSCLGLIILLQENI
jgi:hypothetical protein